MTNIRGQVVIVLKDGLGVIAGEAVGERKTDFGDFIVLASGGDYTVDGAIIDNQVNVGKVQSVVLEDGEGIAFAGDTLDSAYSLGTPPEELELGEPFSEDEEAEVVQAIEGPADGSESPDEPSVAPEASEVVVTTEDIPTLTSFTVGVTVEGESPNVSSSDDSGEATIASDEAAPEHGADEDGDEPTATASEDDEPAKASDSEDAAQAEQTSTESAPADEVAAVKKAPRAKKTA